MIAKPKPKKPVKTYPKKNPKKLERVGSRPGSPPHTVLD